MKTKNNEQQEIIDKIFDYAANLMVEEKKSPIETLSALIDEGLDKESAIIVINNIEQQIKDAEKARANKDMLYGALWCIGGIIVTVVTYSIAEGGGIYFVAWGAVLWGAIQFIQGIINSISSKTVDLMDILE